MKASPYSRVALTLFCGLLSATGFVLSGSLAKHSIPLALVALACGAFGLGGVYFTGYTLREKVQNKRWSEATLVPLRKLTNDLVWRFLMVLALVAMCVSFFFSHRSQQTLFWSAFCLLQTQTQIGNAFARRPGQSGKSHFLDWSRVLPLRSEHWGER